jgi:tRNA nucleotidyltransferase (CCA-adding enzyme)
VPNDIRDLAKLVAEFHDLIHTFPILQPKTIVKLFDKSTPGANRSAWSKSPSPARPTCAGAPGLKLRLPAGRLLREAWMSQSGPTKDVVEAGFKGPEIREELTGVEFGVAAGKRQRWKQQQSRAGRLRSVRRRPRRPQPRR